MIINELNLIGFGQFNNKVIDLKDGLNIIYGENEAGKTTIHNFINGMFYGFLKPYARRTTYLDEHGKYAPWDRSQYSGLIKFTYDKKEYRIERDFTKNQEKTNVFLDSTGEDITNTIDNGSSGRILQPGNHFFGFNNAVFSNTVSIKQLENKTEEALANEVRDKLVNTSESLDDNLSVEEASAALDKSIKEIGTIRATTSPYGRTYQKLNQLKIQKESILENKEEYDRLLAKKDSYDNELEAEVKSLKALESRLLDANILSKNKLFLEAKDLKETIEDLKEKSQSYKKYENLSMEDYSHSINLSNRIKSIDEKIEEYEITLRNLENKINELGDSEVEENQSLVDIELSFNQYEEMEEKKDNLRYSDYSSNLQFLERDFNNNKRIKNALNLGSLISILVSILSLGLSFFLSKYWILAANIITIPLIILFITRLRRVNGLLSRIDSQFKEISNKETERKLEIESIDSSLKSILSKYGANSKLELKRLVDKSQYILFKKEERQRTLNESIISKEDLGSKLDKEIDENRKNKKQLESLLSKNASNNLEEFKLGLENKKIYEDILAEISSKEGLKTRILGHIDLQSLEEEINSYGKDISTIDEALSADDLKAKISHKKDDISNKKIEIGKYDERIKYLNHQISTLVDIEEEINRQEKFLEEADMKKEALQLAKTTIEDISKDIHRQFAPRINKKVGRIIEDISGGKYSSVKIDNKLEIGLVNPETKEIIDINSLSGGTIDQLYFALRFGIVDSINDQELPLILDDCFIQYDDKRLRNIMDFLYKKSKDRQIILFTCHSRESKILDEMKLEYNLINMNT